MKIIGICGSLRNYSWNLKLLINAINLAVGKGVDARHIGLGDLPLFNPDTEEQTFHYVDALRRAVREADALIIACPEHNGSMTAALKNAIEWLSGAATTSSARSSSSWEPAPGAPGP